MNNPAISVVIPVYNSEAHLKECLDSLLFQDVKEPFEVLLAIDPCKDNSLAIALKYSLAHPEIRVLNQEQRLGQAASRFHAIQEAKAPYITFMDADDIMARKGLRTALETIRRTKVDCVNFSFYVLKGNDKSFAYPFGTSKERIIKKEKALALFFNDRSVRGFLWTKVYKKEVFTRKPLIHLFETKDMFEDVAVNFSLLDACESVCVSPEAYYFYRKGEENAATSQKRTDRSLKHLTVFALIRYYLEKENNQSVLKIFFKKLDRLYLSLLFDLRLDLKNGAPKSLKKELNREFKALKKKGPLQVQGHLYEDTIKRVFLDE
jgi:glycosyltransferase involved in cell wall biosynthesis